jgi:hypothetical protein
MLNDSTYKPCDFVSQEYELNNTQSCSGCKIERAEHNYSSDLNDQQEFPVSNARKVCDSSSLAPADSFILSDSFHNTNDEFSIDANKFNKACLKQEDAVLKFFCANIDESFTPFEVQGRVKLNCPITSIRRAITNLTLKGFLIKTNTQALGAYGKKNFNWKLNSEAMGLV